MPPSHQRTPGSARKRSRFDWLLVPAAIVFVIIVFGFSGFRHLSRTTNEGYGFFPPEDTKPTVSYHLRRMFAKGDFRELDASLNKIQTDYEAGLISDVDLQIAFWSLYMFWGKENEKAFDAWVETYPNSYAALFARGQYNFARGWIRTEAAWGKSGIRSSSRDSAKHQIQARTDLRNSLELTRKPILSLAKLVSVESALKRGTAAEDVNEHPSLRNLEQANKIDHQNFVARIRYLQELKTVFEMKDFVEKTKEEKAPVDVINCLEGSVYFNMASAAIKQINIDKEEWTPKKIELVRSYYKQASDKCATYVDDTYGDGYAQSYREKYVDFGWNQKTEEDQLKELDWLLEGYRFRGNPWYYSYRADLRMQQKYFDPTGAWKDLQMAAYLGDRPSMYKIAAGYCEGIFDVVPADQKKCKGYMSLAARLGSPDAQKRLKDPQ